MMTTFVADNRAPDLANAGLAPSLRTHALRFVDQSHRGCSDGLNRNLTPLMTWGNPLALVVDDGTADCVDELVVLANECADGRTKNPEVGVVVLWLLEIKVIGVRNKLCGA